MTASEINQFKYDLANEFGYYGEQLALKERLGHVKTWDHIQLCLLTAFVEILFEYLTALELEILRTIGDENFMTAEDIKDIELKANLIMKTNISLDWDSEYSS